MKRISVLHVGKFYPPHRGGMETHLKDLAVRQVDAADVSVVVSNSIAQNVSSFVDGVRVVRVARYFTVASMPVCPGLSVAIRNIPADIVHIHMPNPGAALAFLMSGHKGKVVITHHSDTIGRETLRRFSDPLVRRVMNRAASIIVTSAGYLKTSEELEPFLEKCHIIPLGIDPAQIGSSGKQEQQEVLINRRLPVILAVGRFVPYKGFEVLIRAMKYVNARLVLIGEGPNTSSMKRIVAKEQLQEKITILSGVDDLKPYYRVACIFVLPSLNRAEAFGIVQLEAMAAGLPVINTNLDSGVPEVSIDGETGLTVSANDVNALAQAMQFLLDNDVSRSEFGKNGVIRVHTEFTADLMAKRTLDLYKLTLDSAGL